MRVKYRGRKRSSRDLLDILESRDIENKEIYDEMSRREMVQRDINTMHRREREELHARLLGLGKLYKPLMDLMFITGDGAALDAKRVDELLDSEKRRKADKRAAKIRARMEASA